MADLWSGHSGRLFSGGPSAFTFGGKTPMATNSWDVMRELATIQERMNRIWGSVYDRGHDDVTNRGTWQPPVDIYETDQREIVLKAEVPGLNRNDIDLTVENQTLTIRGERRPEDGINQDGAYHRVERAYGPFSRSFTLPATVDAGKVRAEYRDGVLTVSLPIREEARPRQIQVNVSQ
jgi:HSP20 family protein